MSRLARFGRHFLLALQFLTRIPVTGRVMGALAYLGTATATSGAAA